MNKDRFTLELIRIVSNHHYDTYDAESVIEQVKRLRDELYTGFEKDSVELPF